MKAELQQVGTIELPRAEVLRLSAADNRFYCKHFFPKAFRQDGPSFEQDFWEKFEDSKHDFFAAEIFREGGKTTRCRAGISKRVAYAISRNILAVCISESMAEHTIRWLKKQVETNMLWSSTFMLQKGSKWTDNWIEIVNLPFETTINVIAMGITSGFRGLNLDDYRPDFIYMDDVCNEENVGTEDQRNKINDAIFGALVPSLAAKTEAPRRKVVMTQTGLHPDDPINRAHRDPTFLTVKYPKLIEGPDGTLKSAWEARFPTADAIQQKEDYTRRGQIHIWLREFGCKLVSRETAPLKGEWLRPYEFLPASVKFFVGLDPAISKKRQAHRTAGGIIGVDERTGDVYIIGTMSQVGKNPDEMWTWLLGNYRNLRPTKIGCETISFQKFLAWYFKTKMQELQTFFEITEVEDRRSKPDRIIQAFSGIGSQGRLWVNPNLTDFIAGFSEWTEDIDWDLGDAVAQAIVLANPWMAVGEAKEGDDMFNYLEQEKDIPELEFEESAP